MSYPKRIVCLANSNKNGGTCVAGRETLPDGRYGEWIRPISGRPTAEISFMESLYDNNLSPKLLDVIDLYLASPAPHHHQTENHLIDPAKPWIRRGKLAWNECPVSSTTQPPSGPATSLAGSTTALAIRKPPLTPALCSSSGRAA